MAKVASSVSFVTKKCETFPNMTLHLFVFRERVREGKREGEKRPCVRETDCLSHAF